MAVKIGAPTAAILDSFGRPFSTLPLPATQKEKSHLEWTPLQVSPYILEQAIYWTYELLQL